MPKPNISPLTFRPSEKSLAFIDALRGTGLSTTDIIQAGLKCLSLSIDIEFEGDTPAADVAKFVREWANA